MTILTRAAVGALGVLARASTIATAPAASATPDNRAAGTRTWTTIESGFGARHQACKVSINDDTACKIVNRLNASNVTGGRLRASMTVTHHEELTQRTWTSGWVQPGRVSIPGVVYFPRKLGYALSISLSGVNAGNGGTLSPAAIGRCFR